mgnify:CR=1 FL=1
MHRGGNWLVEVGRGVLQQLESHTCSTCLLPWMSLPYTSIGPVGDAFHKGENVVLRFWSEKKL